MKSFDEGLILFLRCVAWTSIILGAAILLEGVAASWSEVIVFPGFGLIVLCFVHLREIRKELRVLRHAIDSSRDHDQTQ